MVVKILFLSANPVDKLPMGVYQEGREIEKILFAGIYRNSFNLKIEPAVSVEDLQSLLLPRPNQPTPDIVHFAGHGSTVSAIVLEDKNGMAQEVPAVALSELFEIVNASKQIKCVLLNACYSEPQAIAISEHVGCVIGMTRAVEDIAARAFAASFYQGLVNGFSIGECFRLGRNQLRLMNHLDELMPKIHAPHVDPAKVYLDKVNETREQIQEVLPSEDQLDLVGNWDVSGFAGVTGLIKIPITARFIFTRSNTFEESGIVAGSPFVNSGMYSFEPALNLLAIQDSSRTHLPLTFILSDVKTKTFTANTSMMVLSFRKLD